MPKGRTKKRKKSRIKTSSKKKTKAKRKQKSQTKRANQAEQTKKKISKITRKKTQTKPTKAKEPKTRTEIKILKKLTGKTPQKYHFVLENGEELASVQELIESLGRMDDEIFYHHVNEWNNDFSNWLKDVFSEQDLAEEIQRMHNKIEMQSKMMDHYLNKIIKEAKKKKLLKEK